MSKQIARLEYRPLSKIVPALVNPKNHELAGIASSIRQFGFIDPLLENAASGRLVAGHGRFEAVRMILLEDGIEKPPQYVTREKKTGEWCLPLLCGVSFASEEEAEAYLLADNRSVERGGWDRAALAPVLERLLNTRPPERLKAIAWPETAIRRFLANAGQARGKTPEQLVEGFNNSPVKSLNFYFKSGEYQGILARLEQVMAKEKVSTTTDAFIAILKIWEKTHKPATRARRAS